MPTSSYNRVSLKKILLNLILQLKYLIINKLLIYAKTFLIYMMICFKILKDGHSIIIHTHNILFYIYSIYSYIYTIIFNLLLVCKVKSNYLNFLFFIFIINILNIT